MTVLIIIYTHFTTYPMVSHTIFHFFRNRKNRPLTRAAFSLMEKIEEKRYNCLGFSPKLALFYQFQALFVNVDVA